MSSQQWEKLSEVEFEKMLANGILEVPPEDIVNEVTPWKKAMNRVLVGMALGTITLNFWCLDTILPAIGMVLCLLGFRTLQRENNWMKACYWITVIRTIYLWVNIILNTTIYLRTLIDESSTRTLTVLNLCLIFMELICLVMGLKAVQEKVNLQSKVAGGVALICWYAVMCVLAVAQYNGLLLVLAMIISYIFIIRSLYKMSKSLDEAGYSVQTATVKVNDRALVTALSVILFLGMSMGYAFGGKYAMKWEKVLASEHQNVENIEQQLLKLGMPQYVLDDLTSEDIAACEGALRVVVDVDTQDTSDGKTLQITGVGVQTGNDRDTWMIFHHFLWSGEGTFHGTESIQLWPVYQHISEAWAAAGDVSGRVLYNLDGERYTAPYYFLGKQTFTSSNFMLGEQTNTDVFAAFSMPEKGEQFRGYLAYPIMETQDDYIISSWFNYTHQWTRVQYPVMTAMEKRMTNTWSDAGAFKTIQNALQFDPTEEEIEMIK